jgi:hypothetical protein
MDYLRSPWWDRLGPVYDPYPVVLTLPPYTKGAWILHALRGRLGDAAFFDLLREWATAPERLHGTVITQEFVDLASDYAEEDLNGFFWPYLEELYLPRLVLESTVRDDGPNGPGTRVEIALRQVQPRLFDNVYPLRVVTATPETTTFDLRLAAATLQATYDLSAPVTSVELDPDAWVLWEPAGAVPEITGALTLIYPNPGRSYVTLRFKLEEPAAVAYRIYGIRGRLLRREDLGTVTPEAGYNEVVWNLRDGGGRRVASGVYWATLTVAGVESVRKFAVVR